MYFREFRIQIAILTFLIVLGLGLGAQHFYRQTKVINPLLEKLQGFSGVSCIKLEKALIQGKSGVLVSLGIEDDASLQSVFGQVYHALIEVGGEYFVMINDFPNSKLLTLFEKMQIALEEAITTGEFTLLESRIQKLADEADVKWTLSVDREFIYLSLVEGEQTLIKIICRDLGDSQVRVIDGRGVEA